jgi:hypothetical protein
MIKCAFDRDDFCIALREKSCLHCSFYKTEESLKEGRVKAEERISSLPLETRTHIFRKYNKGRVSDEWSE